MNTFLDEPMEPILETDVRDLILKGQFIGKAPYISNEDYHRSPGLSASGFVKFAKLPKIYQHSRLEPDEEETAAQRLGTLVHMKALEPELFAETVVIIEGNGNSKDVKARIKEAVEAGKYVCRSQKEMDQVLGMVDSIMSHHWAKTLLTTGETEQSLFSTHPVFGFLMKCRPDSIHADKAIISDVKTFTDLDNRSIGKQIRRMKYDWKAVFYLQVASLVYGIQFKKFAHIFISTKAPYPVRVIALGAASMERAETEMAPHFPEYASCLERDIWPAYPDDVEDFELDIF